MLVFSSLDPATSCVVFCQKGVTACKCKSLAFTLLIIKTLKNCNAQKKYDHLSVSCCMYKITYLQVHIEGK